MLSASVQIACPLEGHRILSALPTERNTPGILFCLDFEKAFTCGIFAGCLMWPHLIPLYASQIFKTILANVMV